MTAHEAQLKKNSHPEEGNPMKTEGETLPEAEWKKSHQGLTHKWLTDKHKEHGWLLGLSKGVAHTSYIGQMPVYTPYS